MQDKCKKHEDGAWCQDMVIHSLLKLSSYKYKQEEVSFSSFKVIAE